MDNLFYIHNKYLKKNNMEKLKKGIFPFLIAFSALSVSASAAFYSVSGLSKLFAGASFEVIIMAGSLEISKLVVASLLYQYWDSLNKFLRTYLTVACTILIIITSMGIYGFLSSAYQETYSKLSTLENKKSFIQQKINFYQSDVTRYDTELERISNNISTLSNAKSRSIQVRDTSVVGGVRTTISTSELRISQKRIGVEENNRKLVQAKRMVAADSLQKFQLEVLELSNNNEVAGELGPLQYLSGLTGTPMDKIINILLLVIIFVFDPLAISLVVASNFAFDKAYPKKRENLYGEFVAKENIWDTLEDDEEDEPPISNNDLTEYIKNFEVKDPEEVNSKEEFIGKLDEIEKKLEEEQPLQLLEEERIAIEKEEMEKKLLKAKDILQQYATNVIKSQSSYTTENYLNDQTDQTLKKLQNIDDDQTITY